MKKTILLFATCLLGMCNLAAQSLPGTPIYFYDVYAIMPLDDPYNGDGTGRPDPNQEIIGAIDGQELKVAVGGGAGIVVVVNPITGEVVTEKEFAGQTSITIPSTGSYTAYVSVGNTTVAGEFEVE